MPSKEIWVFHGTAPKNIPLIMEGGFKVGGKAPGVGVANGTVYGNGVYSAKGPGTPMCYSKSGGGKAVILARALQGNIGPQGSPSSDCWEPKGDWAIFRDGSQLLPLYVVHYT